MRKDTIFKLGDRVYAPFHGYGVVTAIHEDACVYPIEVTWNDSGLKNMEDVNTFTADGLLSKYYANTDTILTVVKGSHKRNRRKEMSASKFKVGDRVYAPSYGYGVVTEIKDDEQEYPIVVTWDEKQHGCSFSIFTPEGFAVKGFNSEDDDLTLVEKSPLKKEEEEVGQIAYATHKKEEQNEGKSMAEDKKFKVGDRVFSSYYGFGVVNSVNSVADSAYPVVVKWENPQNNAKELKTTSFYTVDGKFRADGSEAERDIYPLKISSDLDEEAVDPMIDTLDKKTEDAINPSHYKVDGLPEAIDIINYLMHREQLEGFYWGNIIKYAYRYGRKGDKAETAGKIAWYAKKLKELRECESK